jgi:threonine dehydratase
MLLVSDADVAWAIACAHHVRRQVIKREVVVGLAVLLTGKVTFVGRAVGTLISRGNMAPEQPAQILVGQQRDKEL